MKVKIFILYVFLIAFASNNQMVRDFIIGLYKGVSQKEKEEELDEGCFDAETDKYIEQVKMYLTTRNAEALKSFVKNFSVLGKFSMCYQKETEEVLKIMEEIQSFTKDEFVFGIGPNIIDLEKLVVTYYKSETKNGRELGELIGGALKFLSNSLNENSKKKN